MIASLPALAAEVPFSLQGPGVNQDDFEVTVFASSLSFPIGMAELPDGSVLVAINEGANFYNSTGKLIRLKDSDSDGVADGPPQTMFEGLPGSQTTVRIADDLVFVTGSAKPITVLRLGETLDSTMTLAGKINFTFSGSDHHAHSTLEIRPTPDSDNSHDLILQQGSEYNATASSRVVGISSDSIQGVGGTLVDESVYKITITDHGTHLSASEPNRIAKGLRNAAGFAFHPATGDLYLQDNGIDGLVNSNEPHSADELNMIARDEIGVRNPDFGYPDGYTAYRTGVAVGDEPERPVMVFQPIPDPHTGMRSEGPNHITFAPTLFPEGLNDGLFIGFHGKFMSGGIKNDENPLVFANPQTGDYFHFIQGQQNGIGHLDGLLATRDTLYVADLVTHGNLLNGAGAGVIYRIKGIRPPSPPRLEITKNKSGLMLEWKLQMLVEEADFPDGPWTAVENPFSPLLIPIDNRQRFFRAKY
jgi:glucose/arabinose dehydrogenase